MAERLKNIAIVRDIIINKLMLELSAQVLAEKEAKQLFLATKLRGNPEGCCNCWVNLIHWLRILTLILSNGMHTYLTQIQSNLVQ
jgi:hypothetical protein